ncbi:hypothetical protein SRHO_G00313280 [Serrasalmus rhombeus]
MNINGFLFDITALFGVGRFKRRREPFEILWNGNNIGEQIWASTPDPRKVAGLKKAPSCWFPQMGSYLT